MYMYNFISGLDMQTLSYTSFRQNLADALEKVEQGEIIEITRRGHQSVFLTAKIGEDTPTKNPVFAKEDRFNAAMKRVQKEHAKNIKTLADR